MGQTPIVLFSMIIGGVSIGKSFSGFVGVLFSLDSTQILMPPRYISFEESPPVSHMEQISAHLRYSNFHKTLRAHHQGVVENARSFRQGRYETESV